MCNSSRKTLGKMVARLKERIYQLLRVIHQWLGDRRHPDESDGEAHTQEALRYLYNGFRVLGIHMPQRHRIPYIIYSICVNTAVTVWLPLAFLISYQRVSVAELQLGNLLTSIQVAINVVGCSVKIIVMAFQLPKLQAAGPLLARMDARCRSAPDELHALRQVGRFGNRMVVLFAIAYWSYSTSTFLSAFFAGRVAYGTYNPFFDWQESRGQFLAAAFMEIFLMDVACFQQVVDDSYAVIYVGILRTHLRILQMRVRRLCRDEAKSEADNLRDLNDTIKDHKNLLRLFNIIAPVISITIFIQFMITATLLGTTLINILLFAVDMSAKVASCLYIVAVVVEVFPLCYYAQCLMDESSRLSAVIFHSGWWEQPASYRKLLPFYMQRSQRTIELTAGKLFPITLNSFLSIAKFSFTLYTFVKEMRIKEKFGLD